MEPWQHALKWRNKTNPKIDKNPAVVDNHNSAKELEKLFIATFVVI